MGVPKVFPSSLWLSDLLTFVGNNGDRSMDPDRPGFVGILAFEAAAVMSRLVSLYRSLSDQEVLRLRSDTMRSQGVAYLNSTDQVFLLRLACAELIGDLDRAAVSVSRFGHKCLSALSRSFERDYGELKDSGRVVDMERRGLGSIGKLVEKKVRKMERYVAATSKLYAEMDRLNELEAAERRITDQWRRHSGPIPIQKQPPPSGSASGPDPLQLELKAQRQKVRRSKEESLWNKTYDKVVELMSGAVFTVLARIFTVFSSVVCLSPSYEGKPMLRSYLNIPYKYSSGPLEKPETKEVLMLRNSAPILVATKDAKPLGNWNKLLEAPPTTVGGSGLALRYANVIASAQNLLAKKSSIDGRDPQRDEEHVEEEEEVREELYRMIPVGMQASVRAKLREWWRTEGGSAVEDGSLADGWKEAVVSILAWLMPVAHDTLRWHDERNMDRHQRFDTRPRALMLQTLHFANTVKVEAAIVEVLVGLSCMSWYEERQRESSRYQS